MEINRAGEAGTIPGRSARFFKKHNVWFFHTREGADVGPFDDANDAERGLKDFVDFLTLADPKTLTSFYRSLNAGTTANRTH